MGCTLEKCNVESLISAIPNVRSFEIAISILVIANAAMVIVQPAKNLAQGLSAVAIINVCLFATGDHATLVIRPILWPAGAEAPPSLFHAEEGTKLGLRSVTDFVCKFI